MSKIHANDNVRAASPSVTTWSALQTASLEAKLNLAESTTSSAITLGVLSLDCDDRVRAAVADNPATPWLSLLRLGRDKSDDIRYQLAENHNVPLQVLLVLRADENPYVRARAERTLKRLRALNGATTKHLPVGARGSFVSLYVPQEKKSS